MPDFIKVPPRADHFWETMAKSGYTLDLALSELIDNAISAQANKITILKKWKGADSMMGILDNGKGMNYEELVHAMTPMLRDPNDPRGENDLGRYSLGLKSGSMSQATQFYVWTKKGSEINGICQDQKVIKAQGEFVIERNPQIPIGVEKWFHELVKQESGTLVVWCSLREYTKNKEDDEDAKKNFMKKTAAAEERLGMIFHRYLDDHRINFTTITGGEPIKSWNPFSFSTSRYAHKEPQVDISIGRGRPINLQCYLIPDLSKLSEDDKKQASGPLGNMIDAQGIYLYRNERLLIGGGWFGLAGWYKEPKYQLARIRIDLPNTEDSDWNLDFKKGKAEIPNKYIDEIMKHCNSCRKMAAERYHTNKSRGPRTHKNIERMWIDDSEDEQIVRYKINKKNKTVKGLVGQLLSPQYEEALSLLIEISKEFPYDEYEERLHEIWISKYEKQ